MRGEYEPIGKIPPQSLEQEIAVLGCILINPDAYHRVANVLSPEVFYSEANKCIYSHIKQMFADGIGVDTITLIESLRKKGDLERVGGAYYVSKLSNGVTGITNVAEYAKSLYEKFLKRRLIAICDIFKSQAYNDSTDGIKVAHDLTNDVFDALSKVASIDPLIKLDEMIVEYAEKVKDEQERGITLTGLDTKSKYINELTGGLNKGDLFIMAARPGMGKTVRAWKFLVDSCESGIFFSLEMNKVQLAQRVVAGQCGITLGELKKRNIPSIVWEAIAKLLERLKGSKITIQEKAGITLEGIEANIKNHILMHGYIEFAVIDYLQLIDGGKEGNREQQIARISKGLKNMAKKYDIPILALAQLSRGLEQRPNKRPILSDLRESGSIEQDADVVSFLYRPSYYQDFYNGCMSENGYDVDETEDNWKEICEFIVRKNRQGELGVVIERFIGAHATFRDFEKKSFDIDPAVIADGDPF